MKSRKTLSLTKRVKSGVGQIRCQPSCRHSGGTQTHENACVQEFILGSTGIFRADHLYQVKSGVKSSGVGAGAIFAELEIEQFQVVL
jgi:hypothetical protein